MIVIYEKSIGEFYDESSAQVKGIIETIINAGKAEEFEAMIDAEYPDGIGEYELHDMLRDEWEDIYAELDISEDEEEEDDD